MPIRITKLQEMKAAGERIACVTAYDFPSARLVQQAGFEVVLVGDSLGNVVLGYDTTIPVTMDDMLHHTRAVARGAPDLLIVADMPFLTFNVGGDDALRNAGRLLQEGGAHAVKLEGGEPVAGTVRRLTRAGIPVMGHLGLTPQSVNQLGGYRVQGRTLEQAQRLLDDAVALEEAGACSIVLETIPAELAAIVTHRLRISTIGIGAGPDCDGQIQVLHDILGFGARRPKHAKRYADLNETIGTALAAYAQDVREGRVPTPEHAETIDDAVLSELLSALEPTA